MKLDQIKRKRGEEASTQSSIKAFPNEKKNQSNPLEDYRDRITAFSLKKGKTVNDRNS